MLQNKQLTTNTLGHLNKIAESSELYYKINEQYKHIDDKIKKTEGVAYTPSYIAKYIVENTIDIKNIYNKNILDPCVGGGIFIIELLSFLNKKNINLLKILPNIYGFDINPDRVNESIKNILFYLQSIGIIYKGTLNIHNQNFLNFNQKNFDYIIGNPPYINSHNLDNLTKQQLKKEFSTTKSGNGNIFYAFIEQSIKLLKDKQSKIGFIIPNNFLYIKSAKKLREFLLKGTYVDTLINFGDNLPFKPVRTYSSIVFISLLKNQEMKFTSLQKNLDIENILYASTFNSIKYSKLHSDPWHLTDDSTRDRITEMEDPNLKLKKIIKTGIATLKDDIYIFADNDSEYLYKVVDGVEYKIEKNITKNFYKIPHIKNKERISEYRKKVIYPYENVSGVVKLLSESKLKEEYPFTYSYLVAHKDVLLARDSYKIPLEEWYRYGRKQGLKLDNTYKIFFKTFNNKPEFFLSDINDVLFSNGYCLEIANYKQAVMILNQLNSHNLDFYIRNTSYAIEGGYFCYQKKYLERFAVGF